MIIAAFVPYFVAVFWKKIAVAARLRSLRSNDPLNKGYPRYIKHELER